MNCSIKINTLCLLACIWINVLVLACKGSQPKKQSLEGHLEKKVTVLPLASSEVIVNPGKGWILYNKPASFPPEIMALGAVGFHRFYWADFEPEEGKYNWHLLDQYMDEWAKAGKKFAFGIMNLSTHNSNPFSTPEWVFAAGARYKIEDLREVKWSTAGYPGLKAIPVFDDPVYLQKLGAFLLALGKRYDGHPNIAFIDIRSYGNWGEGHMYPFSDQAISPEMLQKHIQLHLQAFKKTLLVLPYGIKALEPVYDWAVAQGIAIRRDGIGGNSDGSETIRCIGKTPAIFELFGSYDFHKERGWWEGNTKDNHGYALEDCLERGKASYIGMREADVTGYLAHEMPLIRRLANRMGYHFVLRKVSFPQQVKLGNSLQVELEVENTGVAYQFEPCSLAFALFDDKGAIQEVAWTDLNTHRWAPDLLTQEQTLISFNHVKKGKYTLAIGLFQNKTDKTPTYKFGIEGVTWDKWYPLHPIQLN